MPFDDDGEISYDIGKDLVIKLKGLTDNILKGKEVRIKGFSREDILEIREMLLKEVKEQNDRINKI